jgi:predicted esterase
LAPLAAHGPFVSMEVEGFEPAVVALPLGATTKRPVIVALHGNFDRPEWQCEVWRDIVSAYAFVLCPRGVRRADAPKKWDRWTYAGAKKTEAELEAGLLALRAEFGDYLAEGSVLFTGFSLGAIYGVGIIHRKPERYSEAILVEGGFKGWSAKLASDYAKGGGRRVLFGCGQAGCRTAAKAAAKVLERQGVATQVAYAGPTGHTYDGKVADAVAQNLSWITEDNPTWGGLTSKMPTGEAH